LRGDIEMLRALIVDDEPIARKVLREELELFEDVAVAAEAENGSQALEQIGSVRPDLVFLDIQMPVMDGFEVIRRLRGPVLPVIVIVTAYDHHAIRAFEAGAVDYLLKPVGEARLRKAIERVRSLHGRTADVADSIARLAEIGGGGAARARKVVGRNRGEYYLLDAGDVLAFQSEGELVWIVTARQRYLANQSLREIEARLKDLPFQRVHRNAIVNLNHVRKMSALSSQRWRLTLGNGQEIVVSKRQATSIRGLLQW
jgi:DNA-binding LytR/AlgR family response regulator